MTIATVTVIDGVTNWGYNVWYSGGQETFEFLGFWVQLAAAAFIIFQLYQTQISLRLAQESNALKSRPYVYLTKINVKNFAPAQQPTFEVSFNHGGATPAVDVWMHAETFMCKPDYDFKFEHLRIPPPSCSYSTIFGDSNRNIFIPSKQKLTNELWNALQAGKQLLVLSIHFGYQDMNKKPYHTEICYVYNPPTNQMVAYDKYNTMS